MLRHVFSRLITSIFALLGASIFSFVILRVAPGDPVRLFLGPFATQDAVARLRTSLGLDLPLLDQYRIYVVTFLRGDWGFSYTTGESVAAELASRFPATIELGLYAFILAFVGAVVGALLASHRSGVTDKIANGISFFGLGVPPFWFGLILLMIFFERLGWLPGPEGRLSLDIDPPPLVTGLYTVDALLAGQLAALVNAAAHLILPVITLALAPFGFLLRLLRANLLDVSREPFITVARSRGLGRWAALVRHALPNAFLPTLAAGGLILGQLLAGSVLVEKAFNWPGVGALVTDAVLRQDFAVVQAFILLSAFVYVIASLLVDLAVALIDPRLRHAGLRL